MLAVKSLGRYTANGLPLWDPLKRILKWAYTQLLIRLQLITSITGQPSILFSSLLGSSLPTIFTLGWRERHFVSEFITQELNKLTWSGFEPRPFDQRHNARSIGWLRFLRMKPVMFPQTLHSHLHTSLDHWDQLQKNCRMNSCNFLVCCYTSAYNRLLAGIR